ncbi:DUF3175 domain-containing protein, partial [Rhizobium ruizarguesonis]
QDVTEHSDAMDLKQCVFKSDDPKKIARSVKHSAEESDRLGRGRSLAILEMSGELLPLGAADRRSRTNSADQFGRDLFC